MKKSLFIVLALVAAAVTTSTLVSCGGGGGGNETDADRITIEEFAKGRKMIRLFNVLSCYIIPQVEDTSIAGSASQVYVDGVVRAGDNDYDVTFIYSTDEASYSGVPQTARIGISFSSAQDIEDPTLVTAFGAANASPFRGAQATISLDFNSRQATVESATAGTVTWQFPQGSTYISYEAWVKSMLESPFGIIKQ